MNDRSLAFPASFVSRATASVYFSALENASDSLSFEAIQDLTLHVPYVVLSIGSDLAAPCTRLKMEYADRAAQHNRAVPRQNGTCIGGVILMFNCECVSHVAHREVESTFLLYDAIPNMHAVAFTGGLSNVAASIKAALYDIIGADRASRIIYVYISCIVLSCLMLIVLPPLAAAPMISA